MCIRDSLNDKMLLFWVSKGLFMCSLDLETFFSLFLILWSLLYERRKISSRKQIIFFSFKVKRGNIKTFNFFLFQVKNGMFFDFELIQLTIKLINSFWVQFSSQFFCSYFQLLLFIIQSLLAYIVLSSLSSLLPCFTHQLFMNSGWYRCL